MQLDNFAIIEGGGQVHKPWEASKAYADLSQERSALCAGQTALGKKRGVVKRGSVGLEDQ